MEKWRDIPGFEGFYQINNYGVVKSLDRFQVEQRLGTPYVRHYKGTVIKQFQRGEYLFVRLLINGKATNHNIHRLLMETFIPNPNNYPCVNHKDQDKHNNFIYINDDGSVNEELSNLEWCSWKYNSNYGDAVERARVQKYKPIIQYTKDGEFVREWDSCWSAGKELGLNPQNLRSCCRGERKNSHGFRWEYKNISG